MRDIKIMKIKNTVNKIKVDNMSILSIKWYY